MCVTSLPAFRHSGEEPAPYSDTGTRSMLTVQNPDTVEKELSSQKRGRCGRCAASLNRKTAAGLKAGPLAS